MTDICLGLGKLSKLGTMLLLAFAVSCAGRRPAPTENRRDRLPSEQQRVAPERATKKPDSEGCPCREKEKKNTSELHISLSSTAKGEIATVTATSRKRASPRERLSYPWLEEEPAVLLAERFHPPMGFRRVPVEKGGFADWLRHLPLKRGRPLIQLYTGRLKENQQFHAAVLDIDVGDKDYQHCADIAMRMRAEYLWSIGRQRRVCFLSVHGEDIPWEMWKKGYRPPRSNEGEWVRISRASGKYENFRRYLRRVFRMANSASLDLQLPVVDREHIAIGDVFVAPARFGQPGHVVVVADIAKNERGEKAAILVQTNMPAQQPHVLKNIHDPYLSPWYRVDPGTVIETPEYDFSPRSLHRLPDSSCR